MMKLCAVSLSLLLLLPATGVCGWNRNARRARRELHMARMDAARTIHQAARETRRALRENRYN